MENLCNLNSRGPDQIQAQGIRVKIVKITLTNNEVRREKNQKNQKKKKTKLAVYAVAGLTFIEDFLQL